MNSALQEESVIASPETVTLPDTADSPQDLHSHPLLLDLQLDSRPSLSQKMRYKVLSSRRYTIIENVSTLYYTDREPGEFKWDLILKMWDNMEKIKLNEAKFINMRPLKRDSRFNAVAQGAVALAF